MNTLQKEKLTAQKVPFPSRPKQKYLSLIIDPGSGKGGWVDRFVIVVASAIIAAAFND